MNMTAEQLCYEIVYQVYSVCTQAVIAVCLSHMCRYFLGPRRKVWLAGAAYFTVLMALQYIPIPFENFFVYSMGMLAAFLVLVLLDQRDLPIKVFICVTFFSIRWLGLFLVGSFFIFFNDALGRLANLFWPNASGAWKVHFGIYILVSVLQVIGHYFAISVPISIINRTFTYKKCHLGLKETGMLLIPSISGMLGYAVLQESNQVLIRETGKDIEFYYFGLYGLFLLNSAVSLAAIVVVIVLFQNLERKREEENKQRILQSQMHDLKSHMKEVEHLYQGIRGLKHDMKNHICVMEGLLDQKKYKEAKGYLDTMQQGMQVMEFPFKTGNPVTDVIFSEKAKEAEQKGIAFQAAFGWPADSGLDAFDLSVILCNALENAIEAAEQCENASIRVSSVRKKNTFLILVSNSYLGELIFDEDTGLPVTLKPDREIHGMGLLNIREVAEKYFGGIDIECRESMFCLTVMLMIN